MKDIEYYINGNSFTNYGVIVEGSSGVCSKLEMKDPLSVDYGNYHGTCVNLASVYYKERNINLSCVIEAVGYDDFITKTNSFISEFEGAGPKRLKIDVGSKPLVYEVYSPKSFDPDKKWNPIHMVGTFSLNLVEPEPVKRVLQFGEGTATITITSSKLVNIYWGDGTHTYDIYGTQTISHTFSSGMHEIIITGDIDKITFISTNCTTLWNKLQ